VGDSVERKYRNEVGNNEDGLTREWLAIVQKRQQLINDRDEIEIKREEKKVEKECTHLNLRINKFMNKKVNRELGPTREQSDEIERLQNRLIQLVEKKNELVFQLDELQDAADMANENFLNSMKTEKDKIQESREKGTNAQGNATTVCEEIKKKLNAQGVLQKCHENSQNGVFMGVNPLPKLDNFGTF